MNISDKPLAQQLMHKIVVWQEQNQQMVLNLKPGELFNGKLLAWDGNCAMLEVAGTKFSAQLQLAGPLPAMNTELQFQVKENSLHRLVLSIVDHSPPVTKGVEANLQDVLSRLGLKPSSEYLLAAEHLIRQQMPVTLQNVLAVERLARQIGTKLDTGLAAAALLLARELPLLPELGKLVAGFMDNRQHLQILLEQIMHFSESTDDTEFTKLLCDFFRNFRGRQQGAAAGGLPAAPERLNTGLHSPTARTMVDLVQQLLITVDNEQGLDGRLQNFLNAICLQNDQTHGKSITELVQYLRTTDTQPELQKMLVDVLNNLTAQQAINKDSGHTPYLYLQLPFVLAEQKVPTEVFIFTQQHKKPRIDLQDLRIVFCLQMSVLGMVKVDLVVKGREMTLRIGLEKERVKNYVEQNLPVLVENLQRHAYRVVQAECFIDRQTPFAYIQDEPSIVSHVDLRI